MVSGARSRLAAVTHLKFSSLIRERTKVDQIQSVLILTLYVLRAVYLNQESFVTHFIVRMRPSNAEMPTRPLPNIHGPALSALAVEPVKAFEMFQCTSTTSP